jgi:hypothetical protein
MSILTKKRMKISKGCKSKDIQHNGQNKKDKITNYDLQNKHIRLKFE